MLYATRNSVSLHRTLANGQLQVYDEDSRSPRASNTSARAGAASESPFSSPPSIPFHQVTHPSNSNATDNCYVDQPSVCDEPNAVSCTNLAKGVTKACCPRLTTCSNETAATKEYVRCNIQFADLRRIDQAESSSSSAASSSATPTSSSTSGQSTPTTTTTALAVLTTTAAIQTPLPPPVDSPKGQASSQSSASLPAGLIGGAAVGATLGFVSLVLLGYLFFRKQARKKRRQQQQQEEEGAGSTAYPQPHPPLGYSHSQHSHHQGVAQKGHGQLDHSSQAKREIEYGYQPGVWSGPPVEVDGDVAGRKWEPVELPSERWQ